MRSGSAARVIADATSTAAQPSSIARAASLAVPMPASRITGHPGPLDDHRDVVRVPDAEPGPDRRAERHDGGAAGLFEAQREHRVVVGVGQHGEPVGDEQLRRFEQLDRVGQQRDVVGDDLELDQVGVQGLAGQPGREQRLGGGVAAGRVRDEGDAGLPDGADQRSLARWR